MTVSITRRVVANPAQMLAWVHAGTSLAERFPGFLGTGWVRGSADSADWHMLYRFADAEQLRAWEDSPERTWWLASGSAMVEHTRTERRVGIEGWFDEPSHTEVEGARPLPVPPRWKQAVMIWLAFFPLSVLSGWLLAPLTDGWALPLRVLLSTLIMTPVMTYLALPAMGRLLAPWLHRRSGASREPRERRAARSE